MPLHGLLCNISEHLSCDIMLSSRLGCFSSLRILILQFFFFGLCFFREKNGVPMKVNGLLRFNMGFQ